LRFAELVRGGEETIAERLEVLQEHDEDINRKIELLREEQKHIREKIAHYRRVVCQAAEPTVAGAVPG